MGALVAYDWPGNVRELENEMRRLVVLASGEAMPEHLSTAILERRSLRAPGDGSANGGIAPAATGDIRAAVADLEKRSIELALARARGNKSKAASELGISRFALQRKLDKYGLVRPGSADDGEEGHPDPVGSADGQDVGQGSEAKKNGEEHGHAGSVDRSDRGGVLDRAWWAVGCEPFRGERDRGESGPVRCPWRDPIPCGERGLRSTSFPRRASVDRRAPSPRIF
jgi:hypothetical protein